MKRNCSAGWGLLAMNEIFAAEPTIARSAIELKLLLGRFGPTTGRYLATVPHEWRREVERAFEKAGPLEQKRIQVALDCAKTGYAVISGSGYSWNPSLTWRENASNLASSAHKKLEAGLIGVEEDASLLPGLITIDQLNLDATAEEEIEANPSEFDRVSRVLISLKGILHIVDPLLDPCKSDRKKVLEPLVRRMGNSGVTELKLWARSDRILKDRTEADLRHAIQSLSNFASSGLQIRLNLLDDTDMQKRMHARCLFSIHGGVAIDNGFQALSGGGKTKVSPMSKSVLDTFIRRYQEDLDHAPIRLSIQSQARTRQF